MVYMQMLFALTFDKLVWGTTPGTLSIIGSSLILGSAIYVAMNKQDPSKKDEELTRANREEERGLMSLELGDDESGSEEMNIPLRPLR